MATGHLLLRAGTAELVGTALSGAWSHDSVSADPFRGGQVWDRELGPLIVLRRLPEVTHPGCDVLSLWDNDTLGQILSRRRQWCFRTLSGYLWGRREHLRLQFSCLKTGETVPVDLGNCQVGGPPCVDFSSPTRVAGIGKCVPVWV